MIVELTYKFRLVFAVCNLYPLTDSVYHSTLAPEGAVACNSADPAPHSVKSLAVGGAGMEITVISTGDDMAVDVDKHPSKFEVISTFTLLPFVNVLVVNTEALPSTCTSFTNHL